MTEAQLYQQVLQQIESDVEPIAIGDYIRYLLTETPLNSLAENQVPALVERAIELGVWSLDYALQIAARIPEPQKRASMYASILAVPQLNDQQRQTIESLAIESINRIDFEGSRSFALLELVPHISQSRRQDVLVMALNLAVKLATEDQWDEGQSLWRLAPFLTSDLLLKASEDLNKLNNPKAKAWAGAAVARQLDGSNKQQLLERSVEAALHIQDELHRANALTQLADQVTGYLVERVLQATLAIGNEQWRPRVLDTLAGQLNDNQKALAVNAALAIQHPWYRAFALKGLIPYLEDDLLVTALEAALTVNSDESFALILGGVTFPPDWHQRVLNLIQKMQNDNYRAQALVSFAIILDDEQKQVVLTQALQIPAIYNSPYTLINLAQQLQEPAKRDLLAKTLDIILQMSDEESSRYPFAQIIDHLPDDLLPHALEGALKFEDEISRSYVFNALTKRLPVELLKHALDSTSANDYESRAYVLINLAQYLTGEHKSRAINYALQAASSIKNFWAQSDVFIRLLAELEGQQRADVTASTLDMIVALPNYDDKVSKLAALLESVNDDQKDHLFETSLDQAKAITDAEKRSRALVALAKHLQGTQKELVLSLALESALQVSIEKPDYMPIDMDYNPRSDVLALVGSEADGDTLTRALQALLNEKPLFWQILMVLDRPFTAEQLELAQRLVKTIKSKVCYGEAAAMLAQHLDGQAKTDALNEAWEIAKNETHLFRRLELLKVLVKQSGHERLTEVINLAIDLTLQMDEENCAALLLPFVPYAPHHSRLLREIRKLMLQELQKLKHQTRESVLTYCNLLQPPVLSAPILASITDSIIEICWH